MIRPLLAIDQHIIGQGLAQGVKGKLAAVGNLGEHGLTKKDLSDLQSIQPAHQFSFLEDFDGMGFPHLLQLGQTALQLGMQPAAILPFSLYVCTLLKYLLKTTVVAQSKALFSENRTQAFGTFERARRKHGSRIRTVPHGNLRMVVPREEPLAVCFDQRSRTHISTNGHQLRICILDFGWIGFRSDPLSCQMGIDLERKVVALVVREIRSRRSCWLSSIVRITHGLLHAGCFCL